MKPISYKIMIIALSALCLFFAIMLDGQESRIKGLQGANSALTSELTIRKTSEGKLLSENRIMETRLKEFEQSNPRLSAEISRQFDIKLRNMRAYMENVLVARGSGNATISRIDTVMITDTDTVDTRSGFLLVIDDGYLNCQAEVYSENETPYQYSYSDTVKQVFTLKGRWWEKKQLYSQAMLMNPHASITNSTSVLVNEFKDKRWGIGPYVGIGIGADLKPQTTFGISVHRSIIKF